MTADIKHNVFMAAHEAGLTLIDAGHFNSEDIFVDVFCDEISEIAGDINVIPFHFSPINYKVSGSVL